MEGRKERNMANWFSEEDAGDWSRSICLRPQSQKLETSVFYCLHHKVIHTSPHSSLALSRAKLLKGIYSNASSLSLSLSLLLLSSHAQDADSKLVLSRTKLSRFEKDYIFDSADTKGFTVVYRLIFHLLNIISIGHRAHTMYIGVHVPGASGSKRRSHHRRHRHHRHHYQPGIAEEASNLADNCTSLFIKYHRPFQITELMIKLLKWIHMFVCSDHSTIAARSVHFGRRGRWRRRRTRIASTFLWNGRTVLQQRRRWGWMEWNCSVSCHYDDETSTLWAFLKWIAFF